MSEKQKPVVLASFEAECNLLSCCFYSADTDAFSINRCRTRKVRPEVFTDPRNRLLYELMVRLHDLNIPTNTDMVLEEMKAKKLTEKIGTQHILDCSKMVGGASQTDYLITRLVTYWKLREVYRQSMEMIERVTQIVPEPEVFNEEIMPRVTNLGDLLIEESDERLVDVVDRVEKEFNLVADGKEPEGANIKLGITEIDQRLTPLNVRRDKYIVIAARPSVGKTALATQIMQSVLSSVKDSVVLDFQLENSRDNHIAQMASRHAQLDLDKKETWTEEQKTLYRKYLNGLRRISEKRLFVYEKDLNIEEIIARARWVKKQSGKITLMVIDYLQLVGSTDSSIRNHREVINHVSRCIKMLAKELDCPILVLSQLSREYMKHGKEPNLQDLKESGNIEADADRVWMLHVPEKAVIDKQTGCIHTVLLQRKNKYGRTGRCHLVHKRTTTTFFAKAKTGDEESEEEKDAT